MILLMLEGFDRDFEGLMVFTFALLHAEHHITVHLHEPAIAVPREALILGGRHKREHRLIIQAEVQDGVHHAWHRIAGTGTHGHEQREAFRIAKLVPHDLFHRGNTRLHLLLQLDRVRALVRVKIRADLRGDREPGRDWQADAAHFGEVRTFAAKQGFHGSVAISAAGSPCVNVFHLV